MKIDKKTIAIIVLAILVAILSYIAYKPSTEVIGESILKAEIERLGNENKALEKKIISNDTIIANLSTKITELQNQKPKIKTVYVSIYKKIDNLTCIGIVKEYKRIFANSGIK